MKNGLYKKANKIFKKKIVKSTNTETVLYKNKNFEMK